MKTFNRRDFARASGGLIAASAGVPAAAVAQGDYPARNVSFIVPYTPGGTVDILARIITDKLTAKTGRTFIVENRPGGSSSVGTAAVAFSQPDGHMILVGAGTVMIDVTMRPNLPYQAQRDLAPVTKAGYGPFVVLTGGQNQLRSLKELVDQSKARPRQLVFASVGIGTSNHLSYEYLKSFTGLDMKVIPYPGSVECTRALLSGEAQLMIDSLPSQMGAVRSGQLRPLAVTGTERYAPLPDVPTVVEAGYPDVDLNWDISIYVTAKTPAPLVEKIQGLISDVLKDPATAKDLLERGIVPGGDSVQARRQQFESEILLWRGVIEKAGIQPQR